MRITSLWQRMFCLILAISFIGCGAINRRSNWNLPEPGANTTGIAAATGAALGAGLGAVIGSTAGNAGEGALIGGVAGAATGVVVGDQFAKRNEMIAEEREKNIRSSEQMKSQENEINDMRRELYKDPLSLQYKGQELNSFNRPSYVRVGENYSAENYRGNPEAKPFQGNPDLLMQQQEALAVWREKTGERVKLAAAEPQQFRGRMSSAGSDKGELIRESKPIFSYLPGARVAVVPAPVAPMPPKAPLPTPFVKVESPAPVEAKVESPEVVAKLPVPPPQPTQPTRLTQPKRLEQAIPFAPKPIERAPLEPVVEKVAPVEENKVARKVVEGPECGQAVTEAKRGESATSQADKLFYYRRALRLCPNSVGYHLKVAEVYSNIGRYEDAQYEYQQVLQLDPTNVAATEEIARLKNFME